MEVELTRTLTENEHACPGLILPKGCRGILLEEDGDLVFRPNCECFKHWACYIDNSDWKKT